MERMGANRFGLQVSGSFVTLQDAYANMVGNRGIIGGWFEENDLTVYLVF
jgi:hypothetical protein